MSAVAELYKKVNIDPISVASEHILTYSASENDELFFFVFFFNQNYHILNLSLHSSKSLIKLSFSLYLYFSYCCFFKTCWLWCNWFDIQYMRKKRCIIVANKTDIKVVSADCKGLNDYKKRKDVFQYYRQQCTNISYWWTHILQGNWKMRYKMNGVFMHTLAHTHQIQEE